jgi:hypothetical protein
MRKKEGYNHDRQDYRPLYSPYIPSLERVETGLLTESQVGYSNEYQQALRTGLVAHVDRVSWTTSRAFTKYTLEKLKRILMATYGDVRILGEGNILEYYGLGKRGTLRRRTRISYGSAVALIEWHRDNSRSPMDKKQAVIDLTWDDKGNYTAYSGYLRDFEKILGLVGGDWELYYAEIDMDTVSPSCGYYLFNHTLVAGGASDEIFYYDEKTARQKKGVKPRELNVYQNNWKNKRQMCNHIMNRPVDYFDTEMRSFIWRSELRIRKEIIKKYGHTRIDDLIREAEDIFQREVYWKQVKGKKIMEMGFSEKEMREVLMSPVIYWIWKLLGLGISMRDARQIYCENIEPMRANLKV